MLSLVFIFSSGFVVISMSHILTERGWLVKPCDETF